MNHNAITRLFAIGILFAIAVGSHRGESIRIELNARPEYFAVRKTRNIDCLGLHGNEVYFFSDVEDLSEFQFEFVLNGQVLEPIELAEFKGSKGWGGETVDLANVVATNLFVFKESEGLTSFEYNKPQFDFIDSISSKYSICW